MNLIKHQRLYVLGSKSNMNRTMEYRVTERQLPGGGNALLINELLEETIDKSMQVTVPKIVCGGWNQTCHLCTPDDKLISYHRLYVALDVANLPFHERILAELSSFYRQIFIEIPLKVKRLLSWYVSEHCCRVT